MESSSPSPTFAGKTWPGEKSAEGEVGEAEAASGPEGHEEAAEGEAEGEAEGDLPRIQLQELRKFQM